MSGTVYLVGAGPGAADLLTLRAAKLLAQADVVFHDALVSSEILSLSRNAKKLSVGKRSGRHSTAQHFINKQLLDAARRYRIVVRLKGGDPTLFGRAHEELSFLKRHSIRTEIVPGVTAALAAAAELGVSLTQRGVARSVSFVTPRVEKGSAESSWLKSALASDTVAIYMGAGEAEAIAAALLAAGKPASTPVVVAQDVSLEKSSFAQGRLQDLPALARACGGGPALILVGEAFYAAAVARRARQASQAA